MGLHAGQAHREDESPHPLCTPARPSICKPSHSWTCRSGEDQAKRGVASLVPTSAQPRASQPRASRSRPPPPRPGP